MGVLKRVGGLYYVYYPQFVPLILVSLFLPIFSKDFDFHGQSLPVGFMSARRAKGLSNVCVIEALPSFLAWIFKELHNAAEGWRPWQGRTLPKASNLWNGVPIKSQLCKESRSLRDRCRSLETHGGVERTTRHIWLAAEAKQCQHVTQIVYIRIGKLDGNFFPHTEKKNKITDYLWPDHLRRPVGLQTSDWSYEYELEWCKMFVICPRKGKWGKYRSSFTQLRNKFNTYKDSLYSQ